MVMAKISNVLIMADDVSPFTPLHVSADSPFSETPRSYSWFKDW